MTLYHTHGQAKAEIWGEPNAPAKLRALSEKQASRQLQPVVGRHFSNLLAANMGEIRVATNTKIQILPLAML